MIYIFFVLQGVNHISYLIFFGWLNLLKIEIISLFASLEQSLFSSNVRPFVGQTIGNVDNSQSGNTIDKMKKVSDEATAVEGGTGGAQNQQGVMGLIS